MNLLKSTISSCKRFFNIPSSLIYAQSQACIGYSKRFSPIFKRHRNPIKGNDSGSASIFSLFRIGSPIAIFWGVVGIVISSFNRFSIWTITHIFKKINKSIFTKPSIANRNPSTAISVIHGAIFVIAAVFHPMKYLIKRMPSKAVSAFMLQTAAGLCIFIGKICNFYNTQITTITFALPKALNSFVPCIFNCNKLSKSFSSYIKRSFLAPIYINTPTRRTFTINKIARYANCFISTITQALPLSFPMRRVCNSFNNLKFSKFQSRKFFYIRHNLHFKNIEYV